MTPLSTYAPDLDEATAGVIVDCSMLVPTVRGFKGAESLASTGMSALASTCMGSAVITKLDNSRRMFAGTATKLYEQSSSSWSDISRVAAYTMGVDNRWRFAQFGNTSLATNGTDTLQSSSGSSFADVTGAPKASCIETTNGFVMLANTNDGTYGVSPDRWWCSAINDSTTWTPSVTTQCTTGLLVDTPGEIRGLKRLGDYILAYKERSMYVGRYVGSPSVFQWTLVPGEVGALSQECIVNTGSSHLFIGNENFYTFSGTLPQPIGDPVRKWFFSNLNPAYKYRCSASIDRTTGNVYFYFASKRSTDGSLDSCLVYNYISQKWGKADRHIEAVVEYITPGVTYDNLGSLASTWDTLPIISYDSPFWVSGDRVQAVFDTSHILKQIGGASVQSTLTTWDVGDDAIVSSLIRTRCRFFQSPSSATATNYYRMNLGDSLTTDSTNTMVDGKFDFTRSSRWHRVVYTFNGDHEISGCDFDLRADGTS